jgi:hypothetical protein
MKKLKYLIICLALSLLFSVNAFAQCSGVQKDVGADPSGQLFTDTEDISYIFDLSIPDGDTCGFYDIDVYWYNPDIQPNNASACEDLTGATQIYNGDIILEPEIGQLTLACDCTDSGNPTCIEVPYLCYAVDAGDVVDNDELLAHYCVQHKIDFDGVEDGDGSAQDPIPNTLLDPCVDVTKNCVDETPQEKDVPRDFAIVVENCGNADLLCSNPELNGGEDFIVETGQAYSEIVAVMPDPDVCSDEPYLVTNDILVVCSVPAASTPTTVQDSDEAACPVNCDACIDVEKVCTSTEGVVPGGPANFDIVISNCGDVTLDVISIDDPAVGPVLPIGPLASGESETVSVTIQESLCVDIDAGYVVMNSVEVSSEGVSDTATDVCPCREETGGEGCTPGYWKIKSNDKPPCWCDTYASNPKLTAVYDEAALALYDGGGRKAKNSDGFTEETLDDALKFQGGGDLSGAARKLLRHGTAALLNACTLNGGGNYPESASTIISDINEALASQDIETIDNLKNTYGNWNECLPCTMSANCDSIDPEDAEEPETQCMDR